jgi:hypothetical protein
MDDDPFRHLWEDDPPRASSGRPAVGNDAQLVPLARAQDAVCPVEGSWVPLGPRRALARLATRAGHVGAMKP